MTRHHRDNDSPEAAEHEKMPERATVSSEAERRAHVSKWIAGHHKTAAATLGTAMLFLPVVAGAQTAGEGLVTVAGIDGVQDVQLLGDGSARIILENGRVLNVGAGDVVIGASGEVQVSAQVAEIVAEATTTAAAGGGGGGLIGAAAVAGLGALAAVAGGGGGGGGGDDDDDSGPAPVVLNASDVSGLSTFADVFGREPAPQTERLTITVGEDGTPVVLNETENTDGDGNWILPDDFAENFDGQEGEVTVSFTAERVVPAGDDGAGDDADPDMQDGDASQTPQFEEVDSGSITLLVDTVPPTITIDPDIAGDDVLNIPEAGEDLIITGTTDAENGQEITVTVAGETYTSTASDGTWSVVIPAADLAMLSDDETVSVEATVEDAAGNPAEDAASASFLTDFTAPTIAIDDVSGDNQIGLADLQGDLDITGTTDAGIGQEVTLSFGGQAFTGQVTAGGEGGQVWSVTVPQTALQAIEDGAGADGLAQVSVSASVEDAAGNPAAPPATITLDADFNGPSISIAAITGDDVINADESASDVTISGTTNNVGGGQDVTVTVGGTALPVVQTDANGDWSVTLPQADAAGLGDGASVTVTADVADSDAVAAPQATATLETDFTGPDIAIDAPIAGDDVLNIAEQNAGFDITGTTDAEDGQEVTVTLSGTAGTPVTATGTVVAGAWSASFTPVQAQDLTSLSTVDVAATVEDAAGNAGEASDSFATDFDAPVVTIDTLPLGADGILGAEESTTDLVITGTATGTDQVTVTFDGIEEPPVLVSDGAWSATIPSATLQGLDPETTIQVSAAAEDGAGNIAEAETSFATDFTPTTVTVDAPTFGAFLNIEDTSGEITVTGTVSGTEVEDVTVSINGQQAPASIDAQGAWTATFAAGALAGLSDGVTEFTVSTQDAAGNTATAVSTPFTVDLTAPSITLDDPPPQPFTLDTAEREAVDGLGFTTSESGTATVTLTVTRTDGSETVDLSLTEQLADIPNAEGLFDFPLTPADLSVLDDQTEYRAEIAITDAAGNSGTDGFELSTDFGPAISLDAIGAGGVLILDDIDPNDVSVSGTTAGVETGEAVTVTILDEGGASIFSDSSATVQGDGTWTLTLPSATVEALDAGQAYNLQADVSNEAGRDAAQAETQVLAYLPAANFAFATNIAGGNIAFEVQTDMSVATGNVLNSVEFTTSFDSGLATLDLSAFDIPNALTTTTIQPNAFNLTELGGVDNNDGSFTFGGNSIAGFDNLATEPLIVFGVSDVDQSEVLEIRISGDAGPNSISSSDQLTQQGSPTPQSFEDSFGPSTTFLGTGASDMIEANDADTLIRGRGGDDAIDLSGAGVNTVRFEAAPGENGFDTITDFSIGGPLPDRLGFAGLDNTTLRGDGSQFELLPDGGTVGADTGLIVFSTALTDFDAGTVRTAIGDLTGPADGEALYFLASDGTDSQLYEVQVQSGDDQVTEMARFEGLGDLTGMGEVNILGFDTNATPV